MSCSSRRSRTRWRWSSRDRRPPSAPAASDLARLDRRVGLGRPRVVLAHARDHAGGDGGDGAAVHLLVFRPLRHAPPLAKVVASVGVLIVLQAMVVLRFGGTPPPVQPFLGEVAGRAARRDHVPQDQLVLAGVVIVAPPCCGRCYRFTRFGLRDARRGRGRDRGTCCSAIRPASWLAAATGSLDVRRLALLGVLVTPVNGTVDPSTMTLLVVPALAAACSSGSRRSVSPSRPAWRSGCSRRSSSTWARRLVPARTAAAADSGHPGDGAVLVIVVALLVRGRGLPRGARSGAVRLPVLATRPAAVGLPKLAGRGRGGRAGFLSLGPTWRLAMTNSLVGVVICLSLVVLIGFVGQVSLAQMALAGFAGFTMAKLTAEPASGSRSPRWSGRWPPRWFGLLAALPALRVPRRPARGRDAGGRGVDRERSSSRTRTGRAACAARPSRRRAVRARVRPDDGAARSTASSPTRGSASSA